MTNHNKNLQAVYEAITQNTPDLIYVFDLNYRFTYANEALLKMWGLTWDEAIGKSLLENGYEPWHAEMHEREIDKVIATKKSIRGEVSFTHATDGKRIYDYIFAPVMDKNGMVEAIAGTTRDITLQAEARRQIAESEKRFRNMVEQAPVAISVLRGEHYVVEVANEKQLELWGKTKEQVLNIPIFTAIPEGAGQGFEALLAGVFTTGKPFLANELPITLIRNGKEETVYSNFIYQPLYDNEHNINGVISVATDVTEHVVARKKIEESENRFRLAITGSTQIVFSQDKNLEHTWIYNSHADFKAEDIIGKTDKDLHTPESAAILTALKKGVLDTGTAFNGDVEIELNGQKAIYTMHIEATKNAGESITGIIGSAMDITERIKTQHILKESEERFRSLAQTLPQLVWVTDAQGNAEFASLRWKEYSGIEPRGEKEWQAIVHPDDYNNISAAWIHSLATGNLYTFDVRLKNRDGEYRWHTVKGEPVLDKENKIVKWVGAFTDIQDQKLREEQKDEFISIASHEMKTPLTTAKAYLQILELVLDENNEEAILYTKKANQAVNRLNKLISELLDVSKIRLGKLNYAITTFNFNEMIESTVENIQLTSKTHTIVKTGKVYDDVTGDKDRLEQVVINLLNNAIKYSPGAEKVLLTIEQEKNTIKVSVTDTGIGMSRQSLNKIFEKYHRIKEHAVHFQGLGIGLFISYEIIQRHHGQLWAESEPGKGSTFYFTIPVTNNLA